MAHCDALFVSLMAQCGLSPSPLARPHVKHPFCSLGMPSRHKSREECVVLSHFVRRSGNRCPDSRKNHDTSTKKKPHPPCEGWGLLSFPVCSRLEDELQGELHDARRNRTAGDMPESGRGAKVVSGRIELSVVPDVIKLRPELRVQRFRNLRVLDEGHVPVLLSGAHDNADNGVSEARACSREKRTLRE